MGTDALAARLAQRLDLLGATRRGAFERHQTLRAAIDWSYELLIPAEQHLFNQLTTFVGGFDLVAAEGVCAPADDARTVADLLANLVDKSMVQVVDRDATRYRILETLREFGLEKLTTLGLADAVRARHTEWYVEHSEEWAAGLAGPEEAASSAQLEREFENCREAHAERSRAVTSTMPFASSARCASLRSGACGTKSPRGPRPRCMLHRRQDPPARGRSQSRSPRTAPSYAATSTPRLCWATRRRDRRAPRNHVVRTRRARARQRALLPR